MLKYKKRRLYIILLSVFIPLILFVVLFFVLKHYQKVDFKDLDLISKTKNIFSPPDKLKNKTATMTEKQIDSNVKSADSLDVIEFDSIGIDNSEIEIMEMTHSDYYADTNTSVLQKEVMIAKKVYSFPINEQDILLDSLLMGNTKKAKKNTLTVEFWLSPVNFKGYKRGAQKVVIFGVTDVKNADIQFVGADLYLLLNNAFFLLSPTNQFLELK